MLRRPLEPAPDNLAIHTPSAPPFPLGAASGTYVPPPPSTARPSPRHERSPIVVAIGFTDLSQNQKT